MATRVDLEVYQDPTIQGTRQFSGQRFETYLSDVSPLGIGLISRVNLPQGASVHLELPRAALPLEAARKLAGFIQITGRIVHVRPDAAQFRVGISFLHMQESDRNLLAQLIYPSPAPPDRRRAPRLSLT